MVQAVYDQAQQTSTNGTRVGQLPALCVLEEGSFNISSAAAPKPWPMDVIAGTTTRCSRQLQKQLLQLFSPVKDHPRKKSISFLKAGRKPHSLLKVRLCWLSIAPDWQLRVDLGKQLNFPDHITHTTLRPDLILFSVTCLVESMWELTVPWEEHLEVAHIRSPRPLAYYIL